MKKYAVLIGNSKFPEEPDKSKLPDLVCPERDVDGLKQILVNCELGGFSEDNVFVLKNQAKKSIEKKIENVFKQANKDDLILIYYSGHGILAGVEGKLFLTSHDTVYSEPVSTSVSMSVLQDILDTKTSYKKIVLILDCCYSGDAAKSFGVKGNSDVELDRNLKESGKGIYLLTACGSTSAFELEHSEFSLFTKYLIEGLKTGHADMDGDGHIDVTELFDYIAPRVKAEKQGQEPRKYGFSETGKLYIAKSGRDSRKERANKIRQLLRDLAEQDDGIEDFMSEAISVAKMSFSELSEIQSQQDQLLTQFLIQKPSPVFFVRKWGEISSTKPYYNEPRTSNNKAAKEQAEQEKAKQAQLARDKEAQDKAAREKAEQEKAKQAQLARDQQAQDKATKEKAEQEKIKQAQLARDKQAQDKAAKEKADKQDQYGRYFDLTVNNVIQRFRWIEAGTFLMGSPAEGQRPVTLSQGYWLADTACTQALWLAVTGLASPLPPSQGLANTAFQACWLAVMDTNPAKFKENVNNPVEKVDWDAVQVFLRTLKQLRPDLNPRLPTSAEWEYACRAGTTTPFSLGDNITPEQVNYNGNSPYGEAKKGLYRKKTVAVKSLPPNDWGLYEMHGNVWEWCNDWYGDYPNEAVTDPTGVSKPWFLAMRVLRGGSWKDGAKDARSAFCESGDPDHRCYAYIGFRVALGQTAS